MYDRSEAERKCGKSAAEEMRKMHGGVDAAGEMGKVCISIAAQKSMKNV